MSGLVLTAGRRAERRNDPSGSGRVYTRLGTGRIIHRFPDGTIAVEFDHGGGHIFLPNELRQNSPDDGWHDSQDCL